MRDQCLVCGTPDRLCWCEFCGRPVCEAHDRPTAFGHACPDCAAKVAAGRIDDHGVEHAP